MRDRSNVALPCLYQMCEITKGYNNRFLGGTRALGSKRGTPKKRGQTPRRIAPPLGWELLVGFRVTNRCESAVDGRSDHVRVYFSGPSDADCQVAEILLENLRLSTWGAVSRAVRQPSSAPTVERFNYNEERLPAILSGPSSGSFKRGSSAVSSVRAEDLQRNSRRCRWRKRARREGRGETSSEDLAPQGEGLVTHPKYRERPRHAGRRT